MNLDEKACPYCAETIKASAIRCKHCHADLSEVARSGGRQAAGDGLEPTEVEELLSLLVERSLVHVDHTTGRYSLLETVRQYAQDRLMERGETEARRDRHLRQFGDLAEQAEPHLKGSDQQAWLERLLADHENLRAALEWSKQQDDGAELGFRLAGAIWRYWMMRGFVSEGRRHCVALFEEHPNVPASAALGTALHGAGNLALIQLDRGPARSLYERAVTVWKEIGDMVGEAGSLGNLGTIEQQEGNIETAIARFHQVLALMEELGDENGVAVWLTCLGTAAHGQADYPAARDFLRRALAINRKTGNRAAEANTLNNLGCVERAFGDIASAQSAYRLALQINRELGFDWEASMNLINLAAGSVDCGDLQAASAYLEEAVTYLKPLEMAGAVVEYLDVWGRLEMERGRHARSARMFGAACTHRQVLGLHQADIEANETTAMLAELQHSLGEAGYEREYGLGSELTLEQGVAYTLDDPPRPVGQRQARAMSSPQREAGA